MSEKNDTMSNFIHVHDLDGSVIHKHMSGITLDYFFDSLNMSFNSTCFVLDNGTAYCNNKNNTLSFYVNGEQNIQFEQYEFHDLDKLLITYGTNDETIINRQIASVTNVACIQSGSCPEQGMPHNESTCIGEVCDSE
jgi:hypothetical protein